MQNCIRRNFLRKHPLQTVSGAQTQISIERQREYEYLNELLSHSRQLIKTVVTCEYLTRAIEDNSDLKETKKKIQQLSLAPCVISGVSLDNRLKAMFYIKLYKEINAWKEYAPVLLSLFQGVEALFSAPDQDSNKVFRTFEHNLIVEVSAKKREALLKIRKIQSRKEVVEMEIKENNFEEQKKEKRKLIKYLRGCLLNIYSNMDVESMEGMTYINEDMDADWNVVILTTKQMQRNKIIITQINAFKEHFYKVKNRKIILSNKKQSLSFDEKSHSKLPTLSNSRSLQKLKQNQQNVLKRSSLSKSAKGGRKLLKAKQKLKLS